SSTLPKIGQAGRVKVSIQSDAALARGSYRVVIKVPNGFTPGTTPTGFTRTTFVDPFSPKAQPNSGDDGSHAYQLTGKASLVPGTTTTVIAPITLAQMGDGSVDVWVDNPASTGVGGSQEFPGGMAAASYTYDATSTRSGIISFPSDATQKSPADWNVDAPASLDIPARELTGWDSSKAANYKRPAAPLDAKGNCPGDVAKQDNGVCPGLTGSGGLTNGLARSARNGTRSIRAHAAATTCMDGQLVYSDMNGTHPSINVPVEAWDVNSTWDDHIGNAMTDWSGNFHICFSNTENSFWDSGTADVQLIFRSSADRFRVVNNCCWSSGWTPGGYNIKTGTRNNVPSGTISLGAMTASDSNFQRAYHAYDELNQAWAWSTSHSPGAGTCWSNGDCNKKTVMWWPESGEWPHYGGTCAAHVIGALVCLAAAGPDSVRTVYHEIGHNVMVDTYGSMPAHSCPSPHWAWVNEERGCAWTEGWPNWYAAAVSGIPDLDGYRIPPTPVANDNFGWANYTSAARGANVENRIASALWDIGDSNNEGVWDRMSTGDQVLWDAFRIDKPQDWEGMIAALSQEGVDTTSSDFRSTLYGNTIDMASNPFRDLLTTAHWASRTLPPVSAPGLSSVNVGATMPGSNSATPVNTSNDHAFSWSRPGASNLCTDTIDVQNVGNWSLGYKQSSNASTFSYNGFTVSAYSNSNMTGLLATASTGATSLWSVPANPTTVYVKVSGQSRSMPVPDGDWTQLPSSMYRIRANKCNPFMIAHPWPIISSTLSTGAVQLPAGKSYTATWTPTGKSSTGKAQKVSLSVGSQGWSSPCVKDTQTSVQCTGTTVGSPSASAKSTSSNAGRPLALKFTTQQNGIYEFKLTTSTGPGSGTVSIELG
ncbi:MAG: hypothetical protein NTX07_07720, partial [Solirubrobacterales bacterium]|nr:hypothetical protein [Solirubrobacterales bacterium]